MFKIPPKKILLLIESTSAYGRKISLGISRYAKEQGNWILYFEYRDVFSVPLLLTQGWNGDGIIARTAGNSVAMRRALSRVSCPVVELLRGRSWEDPPEVLADMYRVMELCIKHYQEKRATSIAFYGFGRCWWVFLLKKAFMELSQQCGFAAHCFVDMSERTPNLQPQWSKKYEKPLIRWLKTLPAQTGLIVADDTQATHVLNVCQMIDIAVPEHLGVLGIDNDEHLCNMTTPALSSLDQNVEMIGYQAAALLHRKMAAQRRRKTDKRKTDPILIPPKGIVVRQSTEISMTEDEDVMTALQFIAEYALQEIRVADIVNHVGVSHNTLVRRFRHALNRTPQDEIIRVRLEHAKFLLTETDMTIYAIALKTCYHSVRYFTVAFRRYTGQTPAHYRNEAWKFKFSKLQQEQSNE